MSEMRESMREMRESIDDLRIKAQALLEVAQQNEREMELFKQQKAESDRRFNIAIEEIRYLARRTDRN